MKKKGRRTTPKHRRRPRGRIRLFVAADPPDEVREAAAAWGQEASRSTVGLRPVPVENCHITLAFIGDVEENRLGRIRSVLLNALDRDGSPSTPELSLGAPVWLPPRRPRALALDVHDEGGALADLQADLARDLGRLLEWERHRTFRPHLTAVRAGRRFDPDPVRLPVSPDLSFTPEAVTLYASTLLPEGARYEALERVDLS